MEAWQCVDAGCTSVQLDTGIALEGKQGKQGKAPCAIHRNRALRLPALRVEIAPRQQAGASFCILSYLSTFPDSPSA